MNKATEAQQSIHDAREAGGNAVLVAEMKQRLANAERERDIAEAKLIAHAVATELLKGQVEALRLEAQRKDRALEKARGFLLMEFHSEADAEVLLQTIEEAKK